MGNELYTKILKQDFGANNGKQFQLIRQKLEVMDFLSSLTLKQKPNKTQQAYIDKVNAEYDLYNTKILTRLNIIALKDMKDVNPTPTPKGTKPITSNPKPTGTTIP